MKKILLLTTAFAFVLLYNIQAQPHRPMKGMAKEKIEEAKKEFLTERLALTEAQSKSFWPLYRTFEQEIDGNREKMKALKRGFAVKGDEQLEKDIDAFFSLKEQETAIERKYFKQFKTVLSIRQVAVLYQSEQQFKRWLFEKLRGQMEPPFRDDE